MVRSVHAFAIIVLLMMQPNGQWYCTASEAPCLFPSQIPVATPDHASSDCCCKEEPTDVPLEEEPCCFELVAEGYVVPAASRLDFPVSVDFEFPHLSWLLELKSPLTADASRSVVSGIDPPPNRRSIHTLFCVRLI